MPSTQSSFCWGKNTFSTNIEHLLELTRPQIGPVHIPRIWAVDRPHLGAQGHSRGSEKRCYIGNDRGTLYECRGAFLPSGRFFVKLRAGLGRK